MLVSSEPKARAYVNHGRWVAECPNQYCHNAEGLEPRQAAFACTDRGCHLLAGIEWPDDPDGIWEALAERPDPATRNWFPHEHHLAVAWRVPHGQTPADLRAEAAEHGVVS